MREKQVEQKLVKVVKAAGPPGPASRRPDPLRGGEGPGEETPPAAETSP